uniref:NADH dehydrogenase subunit 6 n=1 Tax=Arctolamia fruhstorferi TaxID=3109542 RepID=UPI002E7A97D2|nr:NADH dehydrogenase subunit 6 [Arctolamia fruhstorferi]WQM87504.1 NADH dehydrogenase subunit 6 [Arctolamia fruhstorferi]
MSLMFFMSIITLMFMFLFLNHPLSFGMVLLLQTTLISLITGMMNYNYWFSYIIFLVMIGGMLILFIYMTSIASNEKFKFSYKLLMLMILMITIFSMIVMMIDSYFLNLHMMNSLNNQNSMMTNFNLSLNKYLYWPMNLIFYLMIIYLLITLIMVVKITNIKSGPLRQKF